MKIIPKGQRIYLIFEPVREKMVGGLYVSDKHAELTRVAVVQAIGDGVTQYKVGDKVFLSYNAGRTINPVMDGFTPKDDTHRIVVEDEILALIEE